MQITKAHKDFWVERNTPKIPAFFNTLRDQDLNHKTSVHTLINAQQSSPKINCEFHNTIAMLIRFKHDRNGLIRQLLKLSNSSHSRSKRKSYCIKLLARYSEAQIAEATMNAD